MTEEEKDLQAKMFHELLITPEWLKNKIESGGADGDCEACNPDNLQQTTEEPKEQE